MKASTSQFHPAQQAWQKKAFTLIELLVVIAIIAILAALLLSSLAGAKLNAQQTQCVSNLKQMELAHRLYYEDFGNFQGLGLLGANVNTADASWVWLLAPYGMNGRVFLCPSAADTNAVTGVDGYGGYSESSAPVSYSAKIYFGDAAHAWSFIWLGNSMVPQWTNNMIDCSYGLNLWLSPSVSFSGPQFTKDGPTHPSQTPVFLDAGEPLVMPYPTDLPSSNLLFGGSLSAMARHGSRPASAAPQQWNISQRMPGMIDVALFDGHVEKSPLENLWNYYWSANWQVPSPRPGL